MSRLKGLLRVAPPSTCNTQQTIIYAETQGSIQQEEELRHLVYLVGSDQNFRQEDFQEALEIALTDPVEALICFRSLARRAGLL